MVFFFHCRLSIFGHPSWLPDRVKFGWTGVDLFFVLSGFLIASQLFAEIRVTGKIAYKDFFLKRSFRILPAFWFIILIYFTIPFFHEKESLAPLWKYLTFTQNFGLDPKDYGTFSHGWSLCVEEHFYFLLPITLLAICYFRKLRYAYWLLIVLFISGFFIRHYAYVHQYTPIIDAPDSVYLWFKYIYYPSYNRFDGLIAGVSIAALYQFTPRLWARISGYGNLTLVSGLLILVLAYFVCDNGQSYTASVFGFPLVAMGYGFLVMAAISPTCILYKWTSKTTTFIATLSYAIYLSHKGVIHITQSLIAGQTIDLNSNLMLLISMVSCVLAAWLLHIVIEKPFMNLRKKLTARPQAVTTLIGT